MSARVAFCGAAAALASTFALALPASAGHAAYRPAAYERPAAYGRPARAGVRVRYRATFVRPLLRPVWYAGLPCCEFTTVAGANALAPLYNRPLCD